MTLVGGRYNTPLVDPVNVVFVRSVSKLPAPVSNVITLLAGMIYFFEQAVDISPNQLSLPAGAAIDGYGPIASQIISDHSASVVDINFAAAGVFAALRNIVLINSGTGDGLTIGGGALVSIDTSIPMSDVVVDDFIFLSINSVGFASNAALLFNSNAANGNAEILRSGFVQTSASNSIQVSTGVTIAGITLSSVNFSTVAGGVGISLIDDDTQVVRGAMENCLFTGGGTALNNFDEISNAWEISETPPVPDSSDQGVTNFIDTTGRTVTINTQNVWEDIADAGVNIVYVSENTPQKFTLNDSDNGEQIYNGVRDRTFKIEGRVNMQGTGGTDVVEIGISINGATPTDDSIVNASISNVSRGSVTAITTPIVLQPTDTVKLMVRNRTDTSDVDFFQSKLAITF